jgi:hypothetical protein
MLSLALSPGPVPAAEPAPEFPPPPGASPQAPPPPSGARLLGPLVLDEATRRRTFPETPLLPEEVVPPSQRSGPPRYPVEEGVVFEPLVQEDPARRLEFRGMFRIDLEQP